MSGRALAWLSLLLASCATAPADPFASAGVALRRGDLLSALRAYEAVPTSHVRYGEARASAIEIEVRVQRSQEALLQGLVQRSSGHDRAALASLENARDAWPGLPSIDAWIAATRDRLARSAAMATPAIAAEPAVDCEFEMVAALANAGAEVPPPSTPATTAPESEPRAPSVAAGEDPIALGLVAVEARLGHGELELAVIDLLELARRYPVDRRVQSRLVRVLHQRALLRYGQGALIAAIGDWERVIALQPDNRVVQALLDAVRAEAAAPTR